MNFEQLRSINSNLSKTTTPETIEKMNLSEDTSLNIFNIVKKIDQVLMDEVIANYQPSSINDGLIDIA